MTNITGIYILYILILTSLLLNIVSSQVTLNFDNVNMNESSKYIVLHIQKLGFANRIRVLADMSLIASITKRILLFSWEPTQECNIEFSEIFEDLPTNVRLLPFILPHGDDGKSMIKEIAYHKQLSFIDIDHEGFLMSGEHLFSDVSIVYTQYNGVVSLEGVSCELYMYSRTKFYNALIPVIEYRNTIKEIQENYFENYFIITFSK